jgi:hypothetical protein
VAAGGLKKRCGNFSAKKSAVRKSIEDFPAKTESIFPPKNKRAIRHYGIYLGIYPYLPLAAPQSAIRPLHPSCTRVRHPTRHPTFWSGIGWTPEHPAPEVS